MSDEFVIMKHSDIADSVCGPFSQRAFSEYYQPRGWEIVPQALLAAAEALGLDALPPLESLNKEQLVVVARAAGLDPDPKLTNPKLIDLIRAPASTTTNTEQE